MTHHIITTLDTQDDSYAVERLAHLIATWPEARLEMDLRNYAVELPDETPGATLRDVIDALDRGGFLP